MATDSASPREHAYIYRHTWQTVACGTFFFGLLGAIAVSLLPAGYERVQRGQLPTGVAMMVIGIFGIPTFLFGVLSLYSGIRHRVRPPLLRLTATAIILPPTAREDGTQDEIDENGDVKLRPPHPAEIPFSAIRVVRREGPPHSQNLVILHDLCESKLIIRDYMIGLTQFQELEQLLRTAAPHAFVAHNPA
jgi:hypothetical protein